MNKIKLEIRTSGQLPVYSFAGRDMIVIMLPKQMKPVWREK